MEKTTAALIFQSKHLCLFFTTTRWRILLLLIQMAILAQLIATIKSTFWRLKRWFWTTMNAIVLDWFSMVFRRCPLLNANSLITMHNDKIHLIIILDHLRYLAMVAPFSLDQCLTMKSNSTIVCSRTIKHRNMVVQFQYKHIDQLILSDAYLIEILPPMMKPWKAKEVHFI